MVVIVMDYIMLGSRIRQYRTRAGLTQEYIAEKANLSPVFVSLIESASRKPSMETVVKIANVLGTTVDALLQDSLNNNDNIRASELAALLSGRSDKEINLVIDNVSFLLSRLEKDKLK